LGLLEGINRVLQNIGAEKGLESPTIDGAGRAPLGFVGRLKSAPLRAHGQAEAPDLLVGRMSKSMAELRSAGRLKRAPLKNPHGII
jgi:hypothetical protein